MDNQAEPKVAELARNMAVGYCSHITGSRIAPRIDSDALVKFLGTYLTDSVPRKNGPPFTFSPQDSLYDAIARDRIREEFPRIWLAGALLAVGDALKANRYFDHAPELELVYHLRNGVAHGNRFKFTDIGRKRLAYHPAHNRDAAFRTNTPFEIELALEDQPVLFDFMKAGDVLDLLFSVASHLDEIVRKASPQQVVVTEAERLKLIERFQKLQKQRGDSP